MKKAILGMALGVSVLFGMDGAAVYAKKCKMCHIQKPPKEFRELKMQMHQASSMQERQTLKAKMKQMMQKNGMRAPAFVMVSQKLKVKYPQKGEFVAFVDDYIQNPAREKGLCMPKAFERFGVMPPIGKAMSKEERVAVAQWLFDNFKGSWGGDPDAKACSMSNKTNNKKSSMRCGSGKCGGGASKCGAVKIPTH